MERTQVNIVMAVIYGYTVWILGAYVWDWWKNSRRRRQEQSDTLPNDRSGRELHEEGTQLDELDDPQQLPAE